MNRRDVLKMLPLAGFVPVSAERLRDPAAAGRTSYFVVTDRPESDLARLLEVTGARREDVRITRHVMEPVRQDLSVLRSGGLTDPAGMAGPLRHFTFELRRRPRRARWLISVEPAVTRPRDLVVIEQGGRVVEQVRTDRDYDKIEVAGDCGMTVLRLREGELSVVSSSCRHQLCKKSGPFAHGRIVCAPNRLVASMPPPIADGLDAITG